jgi:radical SAM protein with 4Fe4S-binding SPASM domain
MTMSITDRIDATVRMTAADASPTPPVPHAVKIDLMRTCNYRCGFCYHSQLNKRTGAMDFELYKRIIDELKAVGVEEVAPFFFGESFLHPRLAEAIKYARDAGFGYVFLTTNGSIATPEKVRACMEAGLNSLKFSLNYADAQQLADVANVSPKFFQRAIDNIKAARKVRDEGGFQCGLYASYILYDGEQRERMQPVLDEVAPFLDEVYALPLYSQAARIERAGWEFSGGNTGRADNPVPPVPCWALFREGHINFDGTLCACCFSVGDEFTMGDLKTQSFLEAWHSPEFQKLRAAHLNGDIRGTPCEGCIVQRLGRHE